MAMMVPLANDAIVATLPTLSPVDYETLGSSMVTEASVATVTAVTIYRKSRQYE